MSKPGLTFVLWLAIAVFVVLNDVIGDTWIGINLTVRAVEWYKALVPLPYVAMLALIHARRTTGPRWLESALLAAFLWPVSTVLVDFTYVRLTYDTEPAAFLDRFGGPYPLLIGALFALPLIMGYVARLSSPPPQAGGGGEEGVTASAPRGAATSGSPRRCRRSSGRTWCRGRAAG